MELCAHQVHYNGLCAVCGSLLETYVRERDIPIEKLLMCITIEARMTHQEQSSVIVTSVWDMTHLVWQWAAKYVERAKNGTCQRLNQDLIGGRKAGSRKCKKITENSEIITHSGFGSNDSACYLGQASGWITIQDWRQRYPKIYITWQWCCILYQTKVWLRAMIYGSKFWRCHVHRPGLAEFLKQVEEMYELHIYTMGTRGYAEAVAKEIDPTGSLFKERILSRDESGSKYNFCLPFHLWADTISQASRRKSCRDYFLVTHPWWLYWTIDRMSGAFHPI